LTGAISIVVTILDFKILILVLNGFVVVRVAFSSIETSSKLIVIHCNSNSDGDFLPSADLDWLQPKLVEHDLVRLLLCVFFCIHFSDLVLSSTNVLLIIHKYFNHVEHIFAVVVCENTESLEKDIDLWNEAYGVRACLLQIVVVIKSVIFEPHPLDGQAN
jgi:hypothetical protein